GQSRPGGLAHFSIDAPGLLFPLAVIVVVDNGALIPRRRVDVHLRHSVHGRGAGATGKGTAASGAANGRRAAARGHAAAGAADGGPTGGGARVVDGRDDLGGAAGAGDADGRVVAGGEDSVAAGVSPDLHVAATTAAEVGAGHAAEVISGLFGHAAKIGAGLT